MKKVMMGIVALVAVMALVDYGFASKERGAPRGKEAPQEQGRENPAQSASEPSQPADDPVDAGQKGDQEPIMAILIVEPVDALSEEPLEGVKVKVNDSSNAIQMEKFSSDINFMNPKSVAIFEVPQQKKNRYIIKVKENLFAAYVWPGELEVRVKVAVKELGSIPIEGEPIEEGEQGGEEGVPPIPVGAELSDEEKALCFQNLSPLGDGLAKYTIMDQGLKCASLADPDGSSLTVTITGYDNKGDFIYQESKNPDCNSPNSNVFVLFTDIPNGYYKFKVDSEKYKWEESSYLECGADVVVSNQFHYISLIPK